MNDLDELQLRKTSSFPQSEPRAAISQRDATVGARMSSPRRHLRDCTARITGTSTTKYERRQWNLYDLLNNLDHGEQPPQHEQDVDDQR